MTTLNIEISIEILKTLSDGTKLRGDIAKKVVSELGCNRATVYYYLRKLEDLQLVEYFEKDKKIYYKITDKGKKFLDVFL